MSANVVHEAAPRAASVELIALFSRASRNSARVIVPLNESALRACGAGPAFYCVHSLPGTVSDFVPMARLLDTSIRIFGIQVPPAKIQDPMFTGSIEAVAAHYIEVLTAFQPTGPIALGGWSVGATIALEMAQQLRALGREVPLLVAIEDVLTNTGPRFSRWNPLYYAMLIRNLVRRFIHDDLLHQGSLVLFAKRCASRLTAWIKVAIASMRGESTSRSHVVDGFIDASRFSPEHMTFMRLLFLAGDRYVPQEYPGRVTVYAATVPPVHELYEAEAVWAKVASDAEVVRIKGLHSNLVNMPQVIPLAKHLRTRLLDAFAEPDSLTAQQSTVATMDASEVSA
jgi:thioesterase domain-containing protein